MTQPENTDDFDSLSTEVINKLVVDGVFQNRKMKGLPNLIDRVCNLDIPEFDSKQEKLWALANSVKVRPKCYCGANTRFASFAIGFRAYCSVKCAASSEETNNKKKQTSLKNYGTAHPMQNASVSALFVENSLRNGSYSKAQKTFKEKYGVDNRFQLPQVKDKIAKTQII
jgi:hypothetical protein